MPHSLYKHVGMRWLDCTIHKNTSGILQIQVEDSEMASGFLSVVCKVFVIIVLASAALFFSPGEGKYVCQAKCQDIPDCDGWCKSPGGYPKGGQCVPPLYQFCCCME